MSPSFEIKDERHAEQAAAVRTALEGLRSDATKLGIVADALLARQAPETRDFSDVAGLAEAVAFHAAALTEAAKAMSDASDDTPQHERKGL